MVKSPAGTHSHAHNDMIVKENFATKCCFLKLKPGGITTGRQRVVRHVHVGRVKCYYLWGIWMGFNEGVCVAGLMKQELFEFDTILLLKFETMSSTGKKRWVDLH